MSWVAEGGGELSCYSVGRIDTINSALMQSPLRLPLYLLLNIRCCSLQVLHFDGLCKLEQPFV